MALNIFKNLIIFSTIISILTPINAFGVEKLKSFLDAKQIVDGYEETQLTDEEKRKLLEDMNKKIILKKKKEDLTKVDKESPEGLTFGLGAK